MTQKKISMNIHDGWLTCAEKIISPNFFQIPNREVSLLVIHNISLPPNEYGGPYIDQLFTNQLDSSQHPSFLSISHIKVASHLLIDRNGRLKQYVPFNMCARHAGESSYMGRPRIGRIMPPFRASSRYSIQLL